MKKIIVSLILAGILLISAALAAESASYPSIESYSSETSGSEENSLPDAGEQPVLTFHTIDDDSSSDLPDAQESVEPAEVPDPVPYETSAEADTSKITVTFEDGFSLTLPDGWKNYSVSAEMRKSGIRYLLSDEEGSRWFWIQRWDSECQSFTRLFPLLKESTTDISFITFFGNKSSSFVLYEPVAGSVKCCATLFEDSILNFTFWPGDSMDREEITKIIETFTIS